MSKTIKERAVFITISVLMFVSMVLSTDYYANKEAGITMGPEETDIVGDYLRHCDFLDMVDIITAIGEKEKTDISGLEKWDKSRLRRWQSIVGAGSPPVKDEGSEEKGRKKDDTYEKDSKVPGKGSPSKSRHYGRYVLGFYVDDEYILPSSYERMVKYGETLNAVAPFWYRLSPTDASKLQEHHPEEGFTEAEAKRIISKAKSQGIEVLALVHNLLYGQKANGKELAKKMLATRESRGTFINNMEKTVEKFGYDGVNIDIENIYISDRDNFSALIKELHERFSPKGYILTVSIPAKTADNLSNTWSGPFDYKEIAKYSDKVAIMTYDEHGCYSGPGPVASYDWVKNVIKYAVGEMPAEKILMGIPGYGFDWTEGKKGARYISYSQAINIASTKGVDVQWDDTAKVPYFKYRENGQHHEVWFESKYSLEHKLYIVEEYGIGGIALWRIGLEDAGVWEAIDKSVAAAK